MTVTATLRKYIPIHSYRFYDGRPILNNRGYVERDYGDLFTMDSDLRFFVDEVFAENVREAINIIMSCSMERTERRRKYSFKSKDSTYELTILVSEERDIRVGAVPCYPFTLEDTISRLNLSDEFLDSIGVKRIK